MWFVLYWFQFYIIISTYFLNILIIMINTVQHFSNIIFMYEYGSTSPWEEVVVVKWELLLNGFKWKMKCVCVTRHRSVRYVLIMRWGCSNLRQWPLQNLGSIASCYIDYLLNLHPPLLLPSNVLPGGASHSWPASPYTNVWLVAAEKCLWIILLGIGNTRQWGEATVFGVVGAIATTSDCAIDPHKTGIRGFGISNNRQKWIQG